ncbi:glycosyl transferase [Siphonobacter sp. BAB-5385]|uniref:glycosyltransferase family 2 protein n=1 Tax=unclassified Siphonobacter TaxID=2635712 RepID=UPI000B9E0FBB|nr:MULTISPECIES: glycosyltransferase family 2 protein [unclassified Siphonobacter]OZI08555.1 glycosyl transferase [Siphonobacter sp. BAB-5385]PMD93031.1 glycosyl transferase [Siphonobacter sp. BAB-5405]
MISVVIPLFNKAHTIKNTLRSVLDQTFQDFEVVIVDDGSTDDGVNVIRNFTNDERVRIIQQLNQGVSVARNKGVEQAIYNYIAFLDGDDKWLPTYLETLAKAINDYPDAAMYCCAGIVENSRDNSHVLRVAKKYQGVTREIDFFENPHVFLHTSATIVSKEKFNQTVGFPVGMKRNQDYALFFSLAFTGPVIYCGFPLSVYVGEVEGQATSTPLENMLKHVVNRHNIVYGNWKNSLLKNKTYIVFTKYELRHLIMFLLEKNKIDSVKYLIDKLDKGLINNFYGLEKYFYTHKNFKLFSIFLIKISKAKWRLNGYPFIGQN